MRRFFDNKRLQDFYAVFRNRNDGFFKVSEAQTRNQTGRNAVTKKPFCFKARYQEVMKHE